MIVRAKQQAGCDSRSIVVATATSYSSPMRSSHAHGISWCGAPVSKIGGRIKGGLFTSNLSLQLRRSLPSEARPMGDPLPAFREAAVHSWHPNWAVLRNNSVNNTLMPTRFCLLFCGRNLNCGSVNRSEFKFPFVWCVICHRFTVAIVRTRTKQVGMKRGVPGHGT